MNGDERMNITIHPEDKRQKLIIGSNQATSFFAFNFWKEGNDVSYGGRYVINHLQPSIVRVASPMRWWAADQSDARVQAWVRYIQELVSKDIKICLSDWDVPDSVAQIINPTWINQGIKDLVQYQALLVTFLAWCQGRGINFRAWSRHEPNGNWFSEIAPHELASLINFVYLSTGTKSVMGDTNAPNTTNYMRQMLDAGLDKSQVVAIAYHSWWTDPPQLQDSPPTLAAGPTAPFDEIGKFVEETGIPSECWEWGCDSNIPKKLAPDSLQKAILTIETAIRCVNNARSSVILHWLDQSGGDDSSITQTGDPNRTFFVLQQFKTAFPDNTQIVGFQSDDPEVVGIAGIRPDGRPAVLIANLSTHEKPFTITGQDFYNFPDRISAENSSNGLFSGVGSLPPLSVLTIGGDPASDSESTPEPVTPRESVSSPPEPAPAFTVTFLSNGTFSISVQRPDLVKFLQ